MRATAIAFVLSVLVLMGLVFVLMALDSLKGGERRGKSDLEKR